jgi:hypothetical protein
MYVHCKVDSSLFCKVCEIDGDMFNMIPINYIAFSNYLNALIEYIYAQKVFSNNKVWKDEI